MAKSLEKMATADLVYFAEGWDEARGCRIEHKVCEAYQVPHIEYKALGGD